MSVSKDLVNIIKGSDDKGTKAYDTPATVTRVDGSTVWVHIPGGVDETPVKRTINAKAGDEVQVRVSGGSAWINGNTSAPPTDDTQASVAVEYALVANNAADSAVKSAKDASEAAADAKATANSVHDIAVQAKEYAEDALTAAQSAQTSADSALVSLSTVEDVVGVLNWITAHGNMIPTTDVTINPAHVYFVVDPTGDYVVGGTHYSIVAEPKVEDISTYYELSIDESVQNYVATHVVVDTEGLWLIPDSGGNKVLVATGAGSSYTTAGTYIIGKVNGLDTVFAKFTTDGATMNATNNTQIAHLGFGSGNNGSGGTSNAPYFVFGYPRTGQTLGNLSVSEGFQSRASGYASHAEGYGTNATASYSHAEGGLTIASGSDAHAEGGSTTASGSDAHAEGYYSIASGNNSHAQNHETVAQRKSQTAIGEYNIADTTGADGTVRGAYALIIGNGTADNARSNALTVDWSGNVNIASGAKYKINGSNLSASDVGAVALSDKYTRSSTGDLAWTNQTDGDAKVIAKSALAFWNGAYNGSGSNLSKCSTGNIIGSNGGTMTGQLLTSFKTSVAMGSYGSSQTTVPNLVAELRYSSGCMGSASISTAYTKGSITIPTGWYNFIYSPHRSGGANGSASGDNCNYGNLLLMGMTIGGAYLIRVASAAIQEVKILGSDYVKTTWTPTSGSSYSSYGGCYYEKYGRVVHVHIGVSGLTAGTATVIYTLPSGYRPSTTVFAHGTGGAWNNIGYVEIYSDGRISVRSQGAYCGADITFLV